MGEPQSRNEAILQDTIDGVEYTDPPQSRIEDLLIKLNAAVLTGGIKSDTFSGTTTANGNAQIYKDLSRIVLAVYCSQTACTPYDAGTSIWANFKSVSTNEPKTNASVSGTYFYVDAPSEDEQGD